MFDIHSHILFDVDDGARTFDESKLMLKAARSVGIDNIVCTPHCRGRRFDYDRIVNHFEILRDYAESMGFQIALGFEVYWENLIAYGLEEAYRLCIQDTNLLLLEFATPAMPVNWQRMVYTLTGQGITPIIAHPERYRAVQNNIEIVEELKDLGCLIQLSGNFSASGRFSPVRKTAVKLLENNLVDYVASDAHRVEHYKEFDDAMRIARKS